MGSVLSFFRSKRDTKALLEKIQNEIESIEDFKDSASKREKNCICLLFLGFILIYLISAVVFYLIYLNPISLKTFTEIALSFLPFIIFPIIFFCFTKGLHYYYRWISDNKEDRLKDLKKQKKKILEKVKETENFKDAKEILEKYDPKALFDSVSFGTMKACSPPLNTSPLRSAPDTQLRYRGSITPFRPLPALMPSPSSMAPNLRAAPMAPMGAPQMRGPVMTPQRMLGVMPPPVTTVKPILPQNRSIIDKVVDYMVSDGPSNRYALICIHCYSHNGMALKEEFEYIAYFCCYCKRFNPPRKARPNAPRLQNIDQNKRSSLAPLIDEPESDTDSERGRVNSESGTRIQEINSELNKQNETQSERTDQNKESGPQNKEIIEETIAEEPEEVSDQQIPEVFDRESDDLISNNSSEQLSASELNQKSENQLEKGIPFIDESNVNDINEDSNL